ncbi:MFS transporter [Streptomyces sp. NPDC048623]|uniref:MFS transporter n=1 Tax=Streptomyces sp. NPDC048623 TaxID=3155761 RepID=UPI00344797D1
MARKGRLFSPMRLDKREDGRRGGRGGEGATGRRSVRRPPRDTVAAAGSAAVFSCALGLASVALPLLALDAGYTGVEVGVLTAVSGVSQMATRLGLGVLMRLLPDWTLVALAAAVLAVSNVFVVVSVAVVPFVVAQLLQGVARACFWTGSQTHVVRGEGSSVRALATVNFVSNAGLLIGPVLAGLLSERSPSYALGVCAVIAAVAVVPALFLDRLRPFRRPADRPPGRIWRRPGVSTGCWAGVSAGAWRGLLGSYVPVVLVHAGHAAAVVGTLVSVANATSLVGSAVIGRTGRAGLARAFAIGTIVTGGALALLGVLAGSAVAAGLALALSGVGAGAIQTLGPAIASDAVHPEERGEAIAAAGTFRAAALFAVPFGAAGLVAVLPVSVTLMIAGAAIAVPALTAGRLREHLREHVSEPPADGAERA